MLLVARISPAVPEPAVPTPRLFIWKLLAVLVALAVVAVVALVAVAAFPVQEPEEPSMLMPVSDCAALARLTATLVVPRLNDDVV